jgi:hypothetical protein
MSATFIWMWLLGAPLALALLDLARTRSDIRRRRSDMRDARY